MRKKIILTSNGTLKTQPARDEMTALLKGAEKAIRKALPFVEDCDPDGAALFVGEWLGEIADFNAKN